MKGCGQNIKVKVGGSMEINAICGQTTPYGTTWHCEQCARRNATDELLIEQNGKPDFDWTENFGQ